MKIISNFIPQSRYEKRLGNIERFKDKPITIFNDKPASPEELAINPINILIINEPNEFFGLHDYARNYGHLYSAVLSWDSDIDLPNSVVFPHGERNIDLDYCKEFENKERVFEVNFLRGVLNKIEGHHLRHRIFDKESEIKIPHKWYPYLSDFDHKNNNRPDGNDLPNGNPIEGEGKKELWGRNAMFHVAVENSKHNHYFTDKIIDCFCTKTVPLYWGAPYIGDFYDDRGIIHFEDENELIDVINKLTPQDYYDMKGYIDVNYKRALKNSDFFKRVGDFLDELIELNNL
tara:strand:+ start:922 stop:1788 length:867 start_codon:yes stop_codon:yes gene_type:complete